MAKHVDRHEVCARRFIGRDVARIDTHAEKDVGVIEIPVAARVGWVADEIEIRPVISGG